MEEKHFHSFWAFSATLIDPLCVVLGIHQLNPIKGDKMNRFH